MFEFSTISFHGKMWYFYKSKYKNKVLKYKSQEKKQIYRIYFFIVNTRYSSCYNDLTKIRLAFSYVISHADLVIPVFDTPFDKRCIQMVCHQDEQF